MNKKYLLVNVFDDRTKAISDSYMIKHSAIANAMDRVERRECNVEVIEINLDTLETKLVWNNEIGDKNE